MSGQGTNLTDFVLKFRDSLDLLLTRHAELSHASARTPKTVLLGPTSDIPKLQTLRIPITVRPEHKCYDEQGLQLHGGGGDSPLRKEPKKQTHKERGLRSHLYKVSKQRH